MSANPRGSNRNPRSLRSTLVEPFKQVKLGLYILALSTGFMFIFGALIADGLQAQYAQVIEIFSIVSPESQRELIQNDIVTGIVIKLAVASIVYMSLLFTIIFSVTHRFYGPMVSIERFVDSIIEGNYEHRIAVRKRDELNRIVAKLNLMAETLEKRHYAGMGDRRKGQKTERRKDEHGVDDEADVKVSKIQLIKGDKDEAS